MRVRTMSPTGDMTFGQSQANFLVDSPAAVAQTIKTRLGLWVGQWFLDQTIGMPWMQQVIGKYTQPYYDAAIRDRVTTGPGVIGIETYTSTLSPGPSASTGPTSVPPAQLTVGMTVNTQYGTTSIGGIGVVPPGP
jgi:hypothetical protein